MSERATKFSSHPRIVKIAPRKCYLNTIFQRIRKARIIKITGLISNMIMKLDVQHNFLVQHLVNDGLHIFRYPN